MTPYRNRQTPGTQRMAEDMLVRNFAAHYHDRLATHDDRVYFWARAKDKSGRKEPVSHSGVEFMRHWCLHILPKGFTKVRSYGGWSCTRRGDYLSRCASLSPEPLFKKSSGSLS